MIDRSVLFLPQFGPNDKSAVIVEWRIKKGERVSIGDIYCIAETSKSVSDVQSETKGFFFPVVEVGDEIDIGKPIAVLSSDPTDTFDSISEWLSQQMSEDEQLSSQPQVTKKALLLSEKLGIDISQIPFSGNKLREKDIIEFSSKVSDENIRGEINNLVYDRYHNKKINSILILTAGLGSTLALDIISRNPNQDVIGILDDTPELLGKTIMGIPVLGTIKEVFRLYDNAEFDQAFIALGSQITQKMKMFENLKKSGIPFANLIHPTAVIGNNVKIGEGNIILPNCHLGPFATIGDNNYFAASVNIDHDNIIGNHCRFGPGVMLSGKVIVGDQVEFGTGIFVEPHLSIGSKSIIASGTIITRNVPPNSTVKLRSSIQIKPKIRKKSID